MRITECLPCQYGDHDGHYEVVQAVPEGVMGGVRCLCKGECRERARNASPEFVDSIDDWVEVLAADRKAGT